MAILTDGTKLSIKGAGESAANTVIGEVSSIGELGWGEAEEVDVTPLNTGDGYKKYISGLKDMGTVTVSGFKDAADAGQAKMRELVASGEIATWIVEYPDGDKAEFDAFVKKYNFGEMATNNAISWTADLRISGQVTFTEAAGA
jgi:predicted secreted protein